MPKLLKPAKCPSCGGSRISISRPRGFLEKTVLSSLGITARRCLDCTHRFLGLGRPKRPQRVAEKRDAPPMNVSTQELETLQFEISLAENSKRPSREKVEAKAE